MSAQVEEVTASAYSLAEMAQVLLNLVAEFRLNDVDNQCSHAEIELPDVFTGDHSEANPLEVKAG